MTSDKTLSKIFGTFPDASEPNFWLAPDGRALAWNEYGDPDGLPVFYFHGWPSSRWQARLAHRLGIAHRLRIIAMDRPGMGRSEFVPDRRLEDWPALMERFADSLGIAKFAQLGVSGGGPYVLACAAQIPHRLIRSAVLCGAVDLSPAAGGMRGLHLIYRVIATLRHFPSPLWTAALAVARGVSMTDLRRFPMSLLFRALPHSDRQVLRDLPETLPVFAQSFREGVRQGGRGVIADADVYFQTWPFDLSEISHPIHYWHGTQDRNIPLCRVEEMVGKVAGAVLHIEPGLGHFSIALQRASAALVHLAGVGDSATAIQPSAPPGNASPSRCHGSPLDS